eukprot:13773934-Alexandrium_andersonii.AAC.1
MGGPRMDIWTYEPARAMQSLVEAKQVGTDLHEDWEEGSSFGRMRGKAREGRPVGLGARKHRQL